ncbi:SgcJ/EcaC family oxidoreductase [Spirosoma validum]|uniref:SgcJ/EcaC family oxidoreductase n=1 Tax=Spirosoma validum TaxID=2771355 RepID=A0A927AYR7_9BACT|nr:SgcJ/EcaC family oxidoreductase [Spirosoma validum]MBD2752330.1 SgcJ/EcaC family oxidoreductase [Spirosoma validum]
MKTNVKPTQPVVLKVEEAAIRQVVGKLAAAWNAGDAKTYASHLTDDCDYVTFAGQHIKGRQENEQIHQELFDSWALRGSTMHLGSNQPTISFLSPTIALMHSTGTVQLRFQKKPPLDRLSIQTTILTKATGEWKIRAFHNCRVQKPSLFQRILMAFKSK